MQPRIQDSQKMPNNGFFIGTPRAGPNKSFAISTDASNKGIGAVLLQEQPDGSLIPCSYYAKTLNKAQQK